MSSHAARVVGLSSVIPVLTRLTLIHRPWSLSTPLTPTLFLLILCCCRPSSPDAAWLSSLDAMKWLLAQEPGTGKTHYVEKQEAYNAGFVKKVKDFDATLQKARDDPANTTAELQRAAYDKFVAENVCVYRAMVQAAYMDWVVVGKKEEVEYWFAVVDHGTILSRVEDSKASLINTMTSVKADLILEPGSHAIEHSQHTGWQHRLPHRLNVRLATGTVLPSPRPCIELIHPILTPGPG
jgi:hypothetical protein